MFRAKTRISASLTLFIALLFAIPLDISGTYEEVLRWTPVSAFNECSNMTTIYPNTIVNETVVDGYLIFTCEIGFEMNVPNHGDTVLAICNGTSGEWKFIDESPNCKRIFCQSPPLPAHGDFSGTLGFEDTGNYTCDQEYIITDGEDTATCLADGSWSSEPPSCKVSCPKSSDDSFTAYFSDRSCFDVSSTSESWGDANATCAELGGNPAIITKNETFEFLQNILSNVSDSYSDGYWIGGYEKPTDYSWKWHTSGDFITHYFWDETEPTTGEKYTRILLSKSSGYKWTAFEYDYNQYENEGIGYVCQFNSSCTAASMPDGAAYDYNGACYYFQNDGFFTWGSANSIAGDSGNPGCLGLGNRQGFLAEIRDQSTQDAIFDEINNLGALRSYWIGAEREESNDVRTWLWVDGSTISTTWWGPGEPNNNDDDEGCIDLYKFDNGFFMNDDTCSDSNRFVCQFSATNSTTVCGDPGIPYRGGRDDVSSAPFLSGESIEFTCDGGYKLVGAANITCQMDGTWDASPPTCNAVDCGSAPSAANATLFFRTSTEYRGTAVYGCDNGYELVGNPSIYCSMGGDWSIVEFTCQELDIMTTVLETTEIPTTEPEQITTSPDLMTAQDMSTIAIAQTTELEVTTLEYTTASDGTSPTMTVTEMNDTTQATDLVITTLQDITTLDYTTALEGTSSGMATSADRSTTTSPATTTTLTTEGTTTVSAVSPTDMTTTYSTDSTSNGIITSLPQTTGYKTTFPDLSTVGSSPLTSSTFSSGQTASEVPSTDQEGITDMETSLPEISTSLSTTHINTTPMVPLATTVDVTSGSATLLSTKAVTSEPMGTTPSELSTPPSPTTLSQTTVPVITAGTTVDPTDTVETTAATTLESSTGHQASPTTVTATTNAASFSPTNTIEKTATTTTKSSTELITNSHTSAVTLESPATPSGLSTNRISTLVSDVGTTASDSPSFTTGRSMTSTARTSSDGSRTTSPAEPTRTSPVSTTEESEVEESFPIALIASLSAVFGLLLIIVLLICLVVLVSSSNNKKSQSHTLLMTDFGPRPDSPDIKPSNDYITSYEAMVNSVFADEDYRENILNYRPSMPRISSTTSQSHSLNGWSSPRSDAEGAVGSASGTSEPIYAKVYKNRELSVVRFPSTFEERLAEKGLVSFDPSKRSDLSPSDLMGNLGNSDIVFDGTE